MQFAPLKVHAHRRSATDPGELVWLVSWEGYPRKRDRTWQTTKSIAHCDMWKEYLASKSLHTVRIAPATPLPPPVAAGAASGRDRSKRRRNSGSPVRLFPVCTCFINSHLIQDNRGAAAHGARGGGAQLRSLQGVPPGTSVRLSHIR